MRELLPAETIEKRVRELGQEIARDYADSPGLVLVGVMRGSICFLSDLMRAVTLPVRLEFVDVRSYRGSEGGEPELRLDLRQALTGLDVLVVEDIVERGTTLEAVLGVLGGYEPKSVAVAALLAKAAPPGVKRVEPQYVGFPIGNEFVVGYGLDYDERFRSLPFIGVPDEDDLRAGG